MYLEAGGQPGTPLLSGQQEAQGPWALWTLPCILTGSADVCSPDVAQRRERCQGTII